MFLIIHGWIFCTDGLRVMLPFVCKVLCHEIFEGGIINRSKLRSGRMRAQNSVLIRVLNDGIC